MRKAAPPPAKVTEEDVQATIVEGLRLYGYEVLVTSARKVRGAYGSDRGVPDLLVSHHRWPIAMWVGLEVKVPGQAVRWSHPEQARLWAQDRTAIVKSLEDAAAAVVWTERICLDIGSAVVPALGELASAVEHSRLFREVFRASA